MTRILFLLFFAFFLSCKFSSAQDYNIEHVDLDTCTYSILHKKADTISNKIIFFFPGYGAFNPACYGQWIKHLMDQDHTVVFITYQESVLDKRKYFERRAVSAVREALSELQHSKNDLIYFIGHSAGAVAAANLSLNYKQHQLPAPEEVLLIQPGHKLIYVGEADSYEAWDSEIELTIVSSLADLTSGNRIARKIYEETTAVDTTRKRWITTKPTSDIDYVGYHATPCSPWLTLDNNKRSAVILAALRIANTNNYDRVTYWPLSEEMLYGWEYSAELEANESGRPKRTAR